MTDRVERQSEQTDRTAAKFVVFLYFVAALALLPMAEWPRAVITGAVVFPIVFYVAKRWGPRVNSGISVLTVAAASGAVLAMPTFPAMGGSGGRASVVGFIGLQAAAILWAVLWWRGPREEPTHISLVESLQFGLFMAVAISAIAAIPVLLVLMSGDNESWPIFLVFPAYFAGFLGAAVCFWALQRIENLAVGRYLIGVIGGICVYGAMGPVVTLFNHEPFDLGMEIMVALIAGGFVGPAVALTTDGQIRNRLARRKLKKS